jgi:hypothetical protein
MVPASTPVRRFRSPAARVAFGVCLALFVSPVEAQLTDLGAHAVTQCAAPGSCLAFERFGDALAAGDFDGDGFEDLAVGVPGLNPGGSVHVYYGSPGGLSSLGEQIFDQDTPGIGGSTEPFDDFGSALAVGDFDLDGFSDLAIGVPSENLTAGADAGAINVLFGSASGLVAAGSLFFSQNTLPPGSSESTEAGDNFGAALAAAPEGGLAIGVPGESFFLPNETHAGLVQLLTTSGPGSPLDGAGEREQNDFLAECGVFDGNELDERWGRVLAFGRFGSTVSSLVVGGFTEGFDGLANAGRITVMFGSTLGCFDQDTSGILGDAEEGDLFGSALAAGDFDDDGFEDLAIGVPGEDEPSSGDGRAGIVQVVRGSASGLSAIADYLFGQLQFPLGQSGEDFDDHFGAALAAGDFDGDGFGDLAIGVPDENVGAVVDAGTAHALYGSAAGLTTTGSQTFHSNFPAGMPDSPNPDDAFGRTLATGDFDGNGTDDLAVGMPGEDLGAQPEAGAVTVLYGLDRATGAFGTVRFGSAMTVSEVAGNRIVGLIREGGAVLAASVAHSRTGGSATPGTDFNYTAGVESWTAGDLGVEVTSVQILADTLEEADETIVLALSGPSAGLAVGSPATLTITIEDDDEGGIVQFPGPVQVFGEGAGSAAVIVTRGSGAASGVTVQFATSNGSALAGSDYTATSGTLTFAADETSKLIDVPLVDDSVQESAETFVVTLTNPGGGATLGTFAVAQVVIVDNDLFVDGFETGNTSRWSNTIP